MSEKAPEQDRTEILKVINRQIVASHNLNSDLRNFVINQNSLSDALMALVATVRREEREAAFKEAIKWAEKIHSVKLDAARDAATSDEFAAMRLAHEADGVARVIETLGAALERAAATDKENTCEAIES